jgi:hypothetical protein
LPELILGTLVSSLQHVHHPTAVVLRPVPHHRIPVHLVLRRLGWTAMWTYLTAGAVASGALAVAVLYPARRPFGLHDFEWVVLLDVAIAGPLAAAAFWFIARPDVPREVVDGGHGAAPPPTND